MHERQLHDYDGRGQKRIQVRLAHAAVQGVDSEGQRQPGADQLIQLSRAVNVEFGRVAGCGRQLHAEGGCGFQRIDHVHVVGPSFGEILPRMHGGIGADMLLPPRPGHLPLGVMLRQRLLIGPAFVAEGRPERIELGSVSHQPIPEIMPDLMPEVTQERAVGFGEVMPAALAGGVIRLDQIEGDQAIHMAGDDARPLWRMFERIVQNVERQALGIALARGQGQAKREQGVEQAMLRHLNLAPALQAIRS